MEKTFRNWVETNDDYWVNTKTNYIVRDWSSSMRKEWVILDDEGMMISSEYSLNKRQCMSEADFIVKQEKKYGYFCFD